MAFRGTFVNIPELLATQPSLAASLAAGDTCVCAGTTLTWTLENGSYWWQSE